MPDRLSHYELTEEIGVGGMGTVWRATDTRDGSIVAVKVLHAHLARDSEYVRRFEREARVAQRIDSPRVVRVLDSGSEGTARFLVMEYIEGITLAQHVQEKGRLSVAETVRIATAIAEGLDAAHRVGIVHRDVSPQNVMLQADGGVKVTDFGVARDLGATAMTATSMLLGKPQYIAPEVVTGQSAADIRTDIYALGVVMYQMLTGAVPFNAETPYAVMQMQVTGTPPPMLRARSDVPAWLVRVVERCLTKRPDQRYQTPAALAVALGGTGGGATPVAATTGSGIRRPRRALLLAGGGLGVLVFGSVLAMALANSGSEGGSLSATATPSFGNAADDFPTETPAVATATSTPMPIATNEPTPTPEPTEPPLPTPTPLSDRTSCDEIRGTDYRSDVERDWFLANCNSAPVTGLGGRIVFNSHRYLGYDLYVISADGTNEYQLTSGPGFDASPSWSPDGTRIAFVRDHAVHVMNADGSGITRLASNYADSAAWSPRGDLIAFGTGGLFVVRPDGSGLRQIVTENANGPAWSPDGSRLAYMGGDGQLYVVNADGSNPKRLTDDSDAAQSPNWSPDGSRILFNSYRDGNSEIYAISPDGSALNRLTYNPGIDLTAAWSPDGSHIVFSSDQGGNIDLWVMNADGSNQTRLTTIWGHDLSPDWLN